MRSRRLALALLATLVAVGLMVPGAEARATAVPKVGGLSAAGSSTTTAKLGLRWRKVAGATYQVRWAPSKTKLRAAKRYPTKASSTLSPALSNICIPWYAQVRAMKGTKAGAWSRTKTLRFSVSRVTVPSPITTGQTNTNQAQVRWKRAPGAQGYRLHWSPAAYGYWPGYHPYTPFTSSAATSTYVGLPAAPAARDRFMNARYGNPVFAQLQVKRCGGSVSESKYFPVFSKSPAPGDASTGDLVAFGSYNVENTPTKAADSAKIANLADNIDDANLDVVALQEASPTSAADLTDALDVLEGVPWAAATSVSGSSQQIIFRADRFREEAFGKFGTAKDTRAATPLLTPWIRLKKIDPVAAPKHRAFLVMSVHLEDSADFEDESSPPCNKIPQRKAAASAAAASLLDELKTLNGVDKFPVLAAGDFKGSFGGTCSGENPYAGFCDESTKPYCVGEGQPTFIRRDFMDARTAVTKRNVQYGTVNSHRANQKAAPSGVAGRADFIVASGIPGFAHYEVVRRQYGDATAPYQSDHNLIFSKLFVPFTQ